MGGDIAPVRKRRAHTSNTEDGSSERVVTETTCAGFECKCDNASSTAENIDENDSIWREEERDEIERRRDEYFSSRNLLSVLSDLGDATVSIRDVT